MKIRLFFLKFIVLLLTSNIVYSQKYSSSTEYTGRGFTTKVSWQIFSHGPVKYFDKFLVVLEGFDKDNDEDIAYWYSQFEKSGLMSPLLENGWEVVIFNYDTPYDPIENLAMAVNKALHGIKAKWRTNIPYSVVGISMGGLVAGWATCIYDYSKGKEGFPFETGLVFTIDSPHRGAFVPAPIQRFVEVIKNKKLQGHSQHSKPLFSIAAKQLMLNHIDDGNNEHERFFKKYIKIMDYSSKNNPQKRLVGLVSGSWNGASQGFLPGSSLLKARYDGKKGANIAVIEVNFIRQSREPTENKVIGNFYIKDFNDAFCWEACRYKSKDNVNFNFENAPGSRTKFYQNIYDGLEEMKPLLVRTEGPKTEDKTWKYHSFIPTVSAAGLDYTSEMFSEGPSTNLEELEKRLGSMENYSHLHKIIHQNKNLMHAKLDPKTIGPEAAALFATNLLKELQHPRIKISKVRPSPAIAGLALKIYGDGLGNKDTYHTIYFNGEKSDFLRVNSIYGFAATIIPDNAKTGHFHFSGKGGYSNPFPYSCYQVSISKIEPLSAAPGERIYLKGTQFTDQIEYFNAAKPGTNKDYKMEFYFYDEDFYRLKAGLNYIDDQTLSAIIPEKAVYGATVYLSDYAHSSKYFKLWDYHRPPVIHSFPKEILPMREYSIEGKYFEEDVTRLYIDSQSIDLSGISDDLLTFKMPHMPPGEKKLTLINQKKVSIPYVITHTFTSTPISRNIRVLFNPVPTVLSPLLLN